jgi:ferredoxin-NADP reductase
MAKSRRSWSGETGFINQEMLGRRLKDAGSPIYYVAGPPALVKALHEMLNKAGIKDDDIRAEEFAGY